MIQRLYKYTQGTCVNSKGRYLIKIDTSCYCRGAPDKPAPADCLATIVNNSHRVRCRLGIQSYRQRRRRLANPGVNSLPEPLTRALDRNLFNSNLNLTLTGGSMSKRRCEWIVENAWLSLLSQAARRKQPPHLAYGWAWRSPGSSRPAVFNFSRY